MSFGAPFWLLVWGLALPILLAQARRRRRIKVGSLRLWLLIEADRKPKPRFALPPLTARLLLQLAIIFLAGLALAQPRIGAPAPEHAVFLVDVSASMNAGDVAPSRLTRAIDALDARLQRAEAEGIDRVSVIVVGAEPRPVAARLPPHLARQTLAAVEATDGTADWAAAIAYIPSLSLPDERIEIVAFSDGAPLPEDAEVEQISFGGSGTRNAELNAEVTPISGTLGRWRIEGTVTLWGTHPRPEGVALSFAPAAGGGELDWGQLELDAGPTDPGNDGSLVLPFVGESQFPGHGRLTLALRPDLAPHDDRLDFVLREMPRGLDVLYVGPDEKSLLRALDTQEGLRLVRAEAVPEEAARYDLVVAHDAVLAAHPRTNLLLSGGARIAGEQAPADWREGAPDTWRSDHPLSANLDWATFGSLPFRPATPAGGEAVARVGVWPLLEAREMAWGREVRLRIDPSAPGWGDAPALPVLMQNLVRWLGVDPAARVGQTCEAGRSCPLEALEGSARVIGPKGTQVAAVPGAAFLPLRTGLYRIERSGGSRVVPVHATAGEGDLRAPGASPTHARPLQPWQALLAALLAAIAVEAALAWRELRRRPGPDTHQRRRRDLALVGTRASAVAAGVASFFLLPFPEPGPDRAAVAIFGAPGPAGAGVAAVPPDAAVLRAGAAPELLLDHGARGDGFPGGDGAAGAAELQFALALLPPDRPGRILLAGTAGATAEEAALLAPALAARGLRLDHAVPAPAPGDVLVREVSAPSGLRSGDRYTATALVASEGGGPTRISFLADGSMVAEEEVVLPAGISRVEAPLVAGAAAEALIEVEVAATGDPEARNDREGVLVDIGPRPAALLVSSNPRRARDFAEALAVQEIDVRAVEPRSAPRRVEDWIQEDLVILLDVPALDIGIDGLNSLARAVREQGVGLMILGGPNSFGPGGYDQTPLEDLSPLSARIPHDAPKAALVFVIDRSGSMQGQVGEVTRLDIAKAAAIHAAELLHEESALGIVAFDQEAYEVVSLRPRPDPDALADLLAPLQPGGGTTLLPALEMAVEALEDVPYDIRHIIVMTDGLIEQVDFRPTLERAAASEITVSTIAFGSSAVTDRLAIIADAGGGTYHATGDFRALPSILSQETIVSTTSPVRSEETAVLRAGRAEPFLANLPKELPPISRHVATTAKPGAQEHLQLTSADGEAVPLMASWRQGNGRVLAFASDGTGQGTTGWMELPEFPLLWAQIARHFLRGGGGAGLHLSLARSGDAALVRAERVDAHGLPMTGDALTARLAEGDSRVRLRETEPGHFEGRLPLHGPGVHAVTVEGAGREATARLHLGYPAALDPGRDGTHVLAALAQATGGGAGERPPDFEAPHITLFLAPAWRPWLALALALALGGVLWRAAETLGALAVALGSRHHSGGGAASASSTGGTE
ncbi:VWA domain-containing protein [Roseitranquillus sediminis]|uniref:VWA domain-containing protein n=1 Tax=Roseitranquillus sediminis TaxID=2809051 RepID=UPI001D0C9A9A|nr:VWA domain-containing protein [Roseitranquillus sediminis]MBM9594485.1 VWA domain-containing protein [Roseitranquillus sediminis]